MAGSFAARSADASRFSMVPRNDVPRSKFYAEQTHKTTFDAGYLVPVFVDEVLPGDTYKISMTAFARLATPIFPVMDNLHLDSFFFFVPARLVWEHWAQFMGEAMDSGAPGSYLIPTVSVAGAALAPNCLYDYFGVPVAGQLAADAAMPINVLPLRAYNLIYNEWFRDENLIGKVTVEKDDGPDNWNLYTLLKRGKRGDYFTTCLPWPEKPQAYDMTQAFAMVGGVPVRGIGTGSLVSTGAPTVYETGLSNASGWSASKNLNDAAHGVNNQVYLKLDSDGLPDVRVTIRNIREAFVVQRLLEKDARGGTRYSEIIRSHFGVTSPDQRLQRPEYLGGGSSLITTAPIVQSSATGLAGGSTALGTLGGVTTGVASGHRASGSFTEHGYLIGIVCVRADLTYQQGLSRMWTRQTRYDFYWPSFAHLGEQAVLNREIFCMGKTVSAGGSDDGLFGYQERWAEYKHLPNRVSGLFRSTSAGTIDPWHLAQEFADCPVLSQSFIEEAPPLDRVIAVGAGALGKQVLFDSLFQVTRVRAIPSVSVPGLLDHF